MTNVIEVIEVLMAGTLWYMAPEMHYTGKATKESDVYSCGRKPVNLQIQDAEENFLLVQTVGRAYRSGNILSAVDLELLILYLHPA
jgi:serine/threonine protein kinase